MSWLLADEEIRIIWERHHEEYKLTGRVEWHEIIYRHRAIAQEQLKKVYDEGGEPCPHGTEAADTSRASKRECYLCWQDLCEEIGGIG